MEKKVNYIPAVRSRIEKKVGIYCRVSTNDMQQLNSLTAQISGLTRLGADLLIQTNKYHKKSNRTLILIMQPLELR